MTHLPGRPATGPALVHQMPGRPAQQPFDIRAWTAAQYIEVHPNGFRNEDGTPAQPNYVPVGQILSSSGSVDEDLELALQWLFFSSKLELALALQSELASRRKTTVFAELGEERRKNAEAGEKLTDKAVEQFVRAHADYNAACEEDVRMENEKRNLERFSYILDRRVEALRTISANQREHQRQSARPGGQ